MVISLGQGYGFRKNDRTKQKDLPAVITSLDRNTDLRKWSRSLGPSDLSTLAAPRRTQRESEVHKNQYKQERLMPGPDATSTSYSSLLRFRGASVQIFERFGFNVTKDKNEAYEASKNESWFVSQKLSNPNQCTVQNSVALDKNICNPFLSSLRSSPDNNFLKTLVPEEETEEGKTQPSSRAKNMTKKKRPFVPVVIRKENAYVSLPATGLMKDKRRASLGRCNELGVGMMQKSVQSVTPCSMFRRFRSVEAATPLSDMSENQLAQKIIKDEEEWIHFKRALRERTGPGKRVFTHAQLKHQLGTCMRESILNNEIAKGRAKLRTNNGKNRVRSSIVESYDKQLATKLEIIARQTITPDLVNNNKPQWTVVPHRQRRHSMASFFRSNNRV